MTTARSVFTDYPLDTTEAGVFVCGDPALVASREGIVHRYELVDWVEVPAVASGEDLEQVLERLLSTAAVTPGAKRVEPGLEAVLTVCGRDIVVVRDPDALVVAAYPDGTFGAAVTDAGYVRLAGHCVPSGRDSLRSPTGPLGLVGAVGA